MAGEQRIDQVIGPDVNSLSREINGAVILKQNPASSEFVLAVVSKQGMEEGAVTLEIAVPDPSGNQVWASVFNSRNNLPEHRVFSVVAGALYRFRVNEGGARWRVQLSG